MVVVWSRVNQGHHIYLVSYLVPGVVQQSPKTDIPSTRYQVYIMNYYYDYELLLNNSERSDEVVPVPRD